MRQRIQQAAGILYNGLVPVVLIVLALGALFFLGRHLELSVYNLFAQRSAQYARQSPIVLVLIDDESVKRLEGQFGPLFWKRTAYLTILQKIQAHNPAVVLFDTHFVNLNRAEDAHFFQQMQQFPHVVSGLALDPKSVLNTTYPLFYHLKLGVVNTYEDNDRVIRRMKPVFKDAKGVYPSLSLAGALEYLEASSPYKDWLINVDPTTLHVFPEQNKERGFTLPLNAEGDVLIRWYRLLNHGDGELARSHPAIPLWQLFEPNQTITQQLSHKIVILGASSSIFKDYQESPLDRFHLGVDIHATALDNLLFSESLHRAPLWQQLIILVLGCLTVGYLRLRLTSFTKTVIYTAALMTAYPCLAYIMFSRWGVVYDVITPELFMMVGLLVGSTLRITNQQQQFNTLEQTLSQLVSQSVFKKIKRQSNKIKQDGERLEITSLFVDIRGFTLLAENLPPGEITDLLNEFYAVVVSVVFKHRGTIDKFMGDGVLIIFGAPMTEPNHAQMAFNAALELLEVTQALSKRWWAERTLDVQMGLSLNSGHAFVGFLGPVNKLEYTAVGDTVNLCVRLQEQNKVFNTHIVLSEYTVQRLSEPSLFTELAQVQVKGRESALTIYTLARMGS